MNRKIIATMVLVFGSAMANAECTMPEMPSLPSGEGATMEQMIAGQKAVKSFQAANIDYMGCVEKLMDKAAALAESAGGDAKEAAQASFEKIQATYNDAVSAEEDLAGKFNAAIRAYKAANPS